MQGLLCPKPENFPKNKKILITGVSSTRSIAWGVAQACVREGAEVALTYNNERFKERVQELADSIGAGRIIKLDVSSDESLENAFLQVKERWPEGFDGLVHSIAWAPREALQGRYVDGITREGFLSAMNISVYSFSALVKSFLPLLQGRQASVITMSYLGSERIVPNYNTMGVAKAALEASVRFLAADLGRDGVRVNSVSSGPIRTLAASGIKDFTTMLRHSQDVSPLRRLVTTEDVGNLSAFLLSDYAGGITAENIYVDAGFNKVAAVMPPKKEEDTQ